MGRIIDLTGQKFGKLTVLERAEDRFSSSGEKKIYWRCKCDCGNEKEIMGKSLRSGHTRSCGCLQKETTSLLGAKDLTGQRFGLLTVIKRGPNRKNNQTTVTWECQCDCGNTCIVPARYLSSGEKTSCNFCKLIEHGNVKNIIGQKFGHLTVINRAGSDSRGEAKWECECDCLNHNHIIVLGSNLRSGHTQSCGCIGKSLGEEKIISLLNKNNITFKREYTFENCRFLDTNYLAKFDFYVNNQYLIEFDGEQHEIPGWNGLEGLKKIQEHDDFKNKYCKEHNIPLIRIPYTHLDDLCLEDLLLETSKFIVT